MKNLQPLLALAFLAAGSLCLPSCYESEASNKPASVTVQREPTDQRLTERSRERWGKVVAADWIAAYEYQTPEQKRAVGIGQYLQNKGNHKYEKPQVNEVIRNDGKLGLLRVTVLWTPVHELINTVRLEPGQSLTQEVEMYETWRWVDGDWGYMRAQRPEDFFQEHPDLLRAEEKVGDAAPAGPAAPR